MVCSEQTLLQIVKPNGSCSTYSLDNNDHHVSNPQIWADSQSVGRYKVTDGIDTREYVTLGLIDLTKDEVQSYYQFHYGHDQPRGEWVVVPNQHVDMSGLPCSLNRKRL